MSRIHRDDLDWLVAIVIWLVVAVALVASMLALAVTETGCDAKPAFPHSMPGVEVPIRDAPPRHSDGGAWLVIPAPPGEAGAPRYHFECDLDDGGASCREVPNP